MYILNVYIKCLYMFKVKSLNIYIKKCAGLGTCPGVTFTNICINTSGMDSAILNLKTI